MIVSGAIFFLFVANLSQAGSPANNPGTWVTNSDYPIRAMMEEMEGTTGFRLSYDADGQPKTCDITSPSGHAELDEATCRLAMERARFNPGRNQVGKPVGGTYSNRVRWKIPEGTNAPEPIMAFMPDAFLDNWPRGALPSPEMQLLDPAAHYPPTARSARAEGTVQMRLNIDPLGKVADCAVVAGSGSGELDKAACDLMRSEGKFLPALDGAGKPTAATFAARFAWTLPHPDVSGTGTAAAPRPFPLGEPGSATMSIVINADGSTSDCQFSGTGKLASPSPGVTPCDIFAGPNRYTPFRDERGRPEARRIVFRTDLAVEDVAQKPVPPTP